MEFRNQVPDPRPNLALYSLPKGLHALRRRTALAAGETTPAVRPWNLSTPAVDDGLAPGQTTPLVPCGGTLRFRRKHLGVFRSRFHALVRRLLQNPNPTGPALTCHTATTTTASILGLSSCFLLQSAATVPRLLAIGSPELGPPFLLE